MRNATLVPLNLVPVLRCSSAARRGRRPCSQRCSNRFPPPKAAEIEQEQNDENDEVDLLLEGCVVHPPPPPVQRRHKPNTYAPSAGDRGARGRVCPRHRACSVVYAVCRQRGEEEAATDVSWKLANIPSALTKELDDYVRSPPSPSTSLSFPLADLFCGRGGGGGGGGGGRGI